MPTQDNTYLSEMMNNLYGKNPNEILDSVFKSPNEKQDWREAAKVLAGNIVAHPNLYGTYTIYEEIEKIARMVDPTIPEPKVSNP